MRGLSKKQITGLAIFLLLSFSRASGQEHNANSVSAPEASADEIYYDAVKANMGK